MSHANGPIPISQVAMVVRDPGASMKALNETFGWGLRIVCEPVPPKLHDTHLRGGPIGFSMLGVECEVQPGLVVELVPGRTDPPS